jgi:hypothetical protein
VFKNWNNKWNRWFLVQLAPVFHVDAHHQVSPAHTQTVLAGTGGDGGAAEWECGEAELSLDLTSSCMSLWSSSSEPVTRKTIRFSIHSMPVLDKKQWWLNLQSNKPIDLPPSTLFLDSPHPWTNSQNHSSAKWLEQSFKTVLNWILVQSY